MKNKILLRSAFVALFAAIISLTSFFRIPLGPVPIVFQNVMCIFSGIVFGGLYAGAPTALFLAAGLIGLPVYSGGSGGIGIWAGPTGGFLLGYLLAAILAGLIAGKPDISEKKPSKTKIVRICLAFLCGTVIIYIPGLLWFAHWALANSKVQEGKSLLSYTLSACMLPFIPGDLIKIAIFIPISLKIRPILAQYLQNNKQTGLKNNAEASSAASEEKNPENPAD